MKIDRRLNLVVPLYEDEQDSSPVIAYVHSVPLSEDVIDRWFLVLGKTYNAIFSEGFGFAAGPGHAARILRHIAETGGYWHNNGDAIGVEQGLLAEIRRLTNVLLPQESGGWKSMPWAVAVDQKMISSEDIREVENAIVFFIVASATLNRGQRESVVRAAGEIWGAQFTALNSTDFGSSLKMSTEIVNTGGTSRASAKEDAGHANAIVDGKPRSVPV